VQQEKQATPSQITMSDQCTSMTALLCTAAFTNQSLVHVESSCPWFDCLGWYCV